MPDDEVRADEIEEEDAWGEDPDEGGPAVAEPADAASDGKKRSTILAVVIALGIAAAA